MILRFRAVIFVLRTSVIRAFQNLSIAPNTHGARCSPKASERGILKGERIARSSAKSTKLNLSTAQPRFVAPLSLERRSFGYFPSLLKESNVKKLASSVFLAAQEKQKGRTYPLKISVPRRSAILISVSCGQVHAELWHLFLSFKLRLPKKFHFPSVAEILKIHNIILPQTPQNVKCFLPILAPKINQYFFFFSLSRKHLSQRGAKALFSRLFSVSAHQKKHRRT